MEKEQWEKHNIIVRDAVVYDFNFQNGKRQLDEKISTSPICVYEI